MDTSLTDVVNSSIRELSQAHEDLIVVASDLESIGFTNEAEQIREVINEIEHIQHDLIW